MLEVSFYFIRRLKSFLFSERRVRHDKGSLGVEGESPGVYWPRRSVAEDSSGRESNYVIK